MKRVLASFTLSVLLLFAAVPALQAESDADFSASQAARAEAVTAFRVGDLPLALKHMEAALAYRPENPVLLGYVAYLAAETGDTRRAASAAGQYADLGLVPGADILTALEHTLAPDAWAALKARLDANRQTTGAAARIATLPADLKLVEGVAAGPDGTLFLSTVVSRSLYLRAPDGTTLRLLDGAGHGVGSFFGLAYDPAAGLYATYAAIDETPGLGPGEGRTGLLLVDPETGAVISDWRLPGTSEDQQVADIAITADGSIYATDAKGGTVYRLANGQLVPAFRHDGFMSPQGLAETADRQLILADYGRGLWHLDLTTGKAGLIEPPTHVSLVGIDGLARHGERLIAIQNGTNPQRLLSLQLAADGRSVLDVKVAAQALPDFNEPTLGVGTDAGFYFVGASGWPAYGPGGVLKEGQTAPKAAILKLQD